MTEGPPKLPPDEVAEREYVGPGGPTTRSRPVESVAAPLLSSPTTSEGSTESHPVEWAHGDVKASGDRRTDEPFVYETEPEITDAVAARIRQETRRMEIRLGLPRRRGPTNKKGRTVL